MKVGVPDGLCSPLADGDQRAGRHLEVILHFSHHVHIDDIALMAAEKAVAPQLMLHIVQLCIDLVFLAIFQPDQQYIAAALNKFDLPIGDAAAPAGPLSQTPGPVAREAAPARARFLYPMPR